MGLLQLIGLAGAPKSLHQLFRRKRRPDASPKPEIEENAEDLLDPPGRSLSCQATPSCDFDGSYPRATHTLSSDTTALNNERNQTSSDIKPSISGRTSSQSASEELTRTPSTMLGRRESILGAQHDCPLVPQTDNDADARLHDGKDHQVPAAGGNNASHSLAAPLLRSGSLGAVSDTQNERRPSIYESDDPTTLAQKAKHQRFTDEALGMARLALRTNETPVGCVLVHEDKIIAKGMNATNVTRNGTRHAEFMAVSALLSCPPENGPRTTHLGPPGLDLYATQNRHDDHSAISPESEETSENDDGALGHLYPYGQNLHSDSVVDQAILKQCVLYVTVEPCVMCASLLRQLGIKKVYFGAVNDKFGGTGGVFSIHANADPNASTGNPRGMVRRPPPLVGAAGTLGESFPMGGGDGGNVEPGYEIEGGWGRDEAVGLLRRFYVQENGRAPVPRKKEGRAARLAAMMDKDGPDEICAALISAEGLFRAERENGDGQNSPKAILQQDEKSGNNAEQGLSLTQVADSDSDKENVDLHV